MFKFNVRVYGILINEQKQVLVADEIIQGKLYTKFPGGGLEFGEGTRDCLVREFEEELDLKVQVGEHLYTTDFFVPSAFHSQQQIISIYYLVHPLEAIKPHYLKQPLLIKSQPAQDVSGDFIEAFRFINCQDLTVDAVTLPIDKIAVKVLKERY